MDEVNTAITGKINNYLVTFTHTLTWISSVSSLQKVFISIVDKFNKKSSKDADEIILQ